MPPSSKSKVVVDGEKEVQDFARESIVSILDIPEGSIITKDMVWIKRPGTGIPSKYLNDVIGMKAKEEIKINTMINWNDLK